MPWPPNRPAKVGKCTYAQWLQQRPHVDNPGRRPVPPHFRLGFAILGWREACNYYRANWRVICRWVNECDKPALLAERAAMRRNPERHRLKAQMAAYWTSEPRDPAWALKYKSAAHD
jgi:hypothetical protein